MFYEEELVMALTSLLSGIPSMLFGLATYVLSALALYTIAKRRGLNNPWLAWIPVVNCWLLGSLSDQYRYVVKGENKSKRKVLLTLNLINVAITVLIFVLLIVMIVGVIQYEVYDISEEQMLASVMGPLFGMLGLCLPLLGVSIAFYIIRYMALYDVFKSIDPGNCVLFLVLSILINITEPFFLFFNREKDLGMPPRKQEYAYVPEPEPQWQEPVQNPWENENKDYL